MEFQLQEVYDEFMESRLFDSFSEKRKKEISIMSERKKFTTEQAREIGEEPGIDWKKFNVEELRNGMNVELEHGSTDILTNVTNDDPLATAKIALAHLNEFPDYYTRLDKMETDAKAYWKNK